MEEDRDISTPNVQFFIDELARVSADNDRRYVALSRRVTSLEDNNRGGTFDEMNPMGPLVGIICIMMISELVIPLVIEGVRRWRSPSLQSSE